MAASISASARSICRRRVACWRLKSASVSRPARFVAAVRSRTSAVRASWSSCSSARIAGAGACGRGSIIAPMRAISRASTRSVLAWVPIASAKRRTRAGFSFE